MGRFYEAKFPKVGDIVAVQIKQRCDFGIYAQLLEYDSKVGLIPLSGISKWVTKIPSNMRVGRVDICTVLKVDHTKGNMDLSKSQVSVVDKAAKEAHFRKARVLHSVMRHVAYSNGLEVEDLCSKVSWPLHARSSDALAELSRHVHGEIDLWKDLDFSKPGKDLSGLASKLKTQIAAEVRRRLDQQMLRLRAKVEVSCFAYEGIDAVIEALEKGKAASSKNCELQIRLIAHPLFVIDCTCRRREDGVDGIDAACDLIERSIRAAGGLFRLRSHPDYADHELESEPVEEEESWGVDGEDEENEPLSEPLKEGLNEAALQAHTAAMAGRPDDEFERMKEMLMSDEDPG